MLLPHISILSRVPFGNVVAILLISTFLIGCESTTPTKESTVNNGLSTDGNNNIAIKDESTDQTARTTNKQDTETHSVQNELDLWQRIRNGYQLGDQSIPTVGQQRIDNILSQYSKHPESLRRQTKRASLYIHYVISELEKNDLPSELALLPFVESGYDPFAYSSGRASGLWQFIPGTGKRFKLEENWWMDERRDVEESTQAAIRYFKYLHRHFKGNWLHAIAAYNAGEGTVGRAIKRNKRKGKATDYWSLPLPKETRFYIPKLLAWAELVNRPAHYQITLTPIKNEPSFTSVEIGSQIDLAKFADITQIDIKEIYALNPAFNHWATDPAAPHRLLVPADKTDHAKQSLSEYPVDQRIQWQRYSIRSGDSLSVIAEKFNTSVATIKSINHIYGSRIRAGKVLLIPKASKAANYYSNSSSQRLAKRQKGPSKGNKNKIVHTVQAGETLWSISRNYKVTPANIAYWNNMSVRDVLRNNQQLVIWSSEAQTRNKRASSIVRKVHYSVRSGDSLSTIANKFNVSIHDLRSWNKIQKQKYIQPGETLRLYVSVADQARRF